jgi:hypothetical protein
MAKNLREINIATVPIFIGLIAAFYIFNVGQGLANTVEFTADTTLDLTGLETTTYFASGSKADSLTISGANLNVYGIWDSITFQLKTAGHKVLQLTTSGGTADLTFSSANVSSGYVDEWTVSSSVSVTYLIGVPKADTYYAVEVGGLPIDGSPFDSGPSAEVSFSRSGGAVYTIEEVVVTLTVETLLPTDITIGSATLRGKLTERSGAGTVHVWFKWDTDETLIDPETTAEQEMVGLGIFRADISSLVEGETYYFQAVAEDQTTELLAEGAILNFVAREGLFITVTMGGKTRIIEIDREGRIIIQRE